VRLTNAGKAFIWGYGLLGLISLTAYASGGPRGTQIFGTSFAIFLVSLVILFLIHRYLSNRRLFGSGPIWPLFESKDEKDKQEKSEWEEHFKNEKRKMEEQFDQEKSEWQKQFNQDNRKKEETISDSDISDLKKYYQILDLAENASSTEIKNSFREGIKFYHPDKFESKSPEDKERAKKKAEKINVAYEELQKAGKVD